MESGAILPEGDRGDIRRIVRISRVAGVLVALALGIAAYWVQRDDPLSARAAVAYLTVIVGLGAFVALSTLARVGHANVLERSLEQVRNLTGQLRQMAEEDPLTGLLNLRTFHALAEQEIDLARLERRSVSLIVADLDNFKVLNDSFGHQFGDMVLCETARVFAAAGPAGSSSARLGGDEFALLLAGLGREEAVGVANTIDAQLREHGQEVPSAGTLGSFGVATFPSDGDSVQALFAAADGRMYSEKHRRKAESLASLAGASRKLFVRVGRAMRPDQTMTQILQEVTRAAREEFDLTLCAITIKPRSHHPRVAVASADDAALEATCIEAGTRDELTASVLGARLRADAWVIDAPIPDESGDGGALALAGLPMSSFRPDAPVVMALADLVQAVVANARARVEAVRAGRERDIHIELAHVLAGGGTLHERLSGVTRKIAEFIGVPMVTIQGVAASNSAETYNIATGFGDTPRYKWLDARTSPKGRAFVETMAAESPCMLIDPANDDRVPDYERELLSAAGARVAAICPIRFDGEALGIVCALSEERGYFHEDNIAVLMTIADHLAPAINVALLRDQLEASYSELEKESRESLSRLADAAEARDPHTGGHLRRIRHYSVELARCVGLPEDEAQAIGLASTIHDLGKLSLSDEVLHKPGKLTPEDWAQMRAHPQHGERLIGRSPKFDTERIVARWHHERWDGTGYPDGLRGEAIPIAARIVAVADAFDALTTERPYKRAWTLEEAVNELIDSRGKLFCPRVVDALESLWRSGRLAEIYEAAELDEHAAAHEHRKAA
ncbi:MAG: diguanylate cyclase [Dehalococcoidia bacterium]|nr:MAG: diguanylate cyclase [Dehalococcoidia bacterium]